MEKHNHLSGALVERAYAEAAARYAKAKDADRAARRELHRVAGAFFSREEARRAEKLLSQWPEGGDEALSPHSLSACLHARAPAACGHGRALRAFVRDKRESPGTCSISPAV